MNQSLPDYFGRKWSIFLDPLPGQRGVKAFQLSNASIPFDQKDSLKVEFFVDKIYWQSLWWADIKIFNPSLTKDINTKRGLDLKLLQPGTTVKLSAGYQKTFATDTNTIFQGSLFQPTWERRDVVTGVLTLRCVVGLEYWVQNFVSASFAAGQTQADILTNIAKQAKNTIPIDQIDGTALQQKLPRGKAVFGRPRDIVQQIANSNALVSHFGENGLKVMANAFDVTTPPKVIYSPANMTIHPRDVDDIKKVKPTLIGVPQQTTQGMNFKILLDSSVQVGDVVQLFTTTTKPLPLIPGQLPPLVNPDGKYLVAAIHHAGDTRGNDWHTEITGVTSAFWTAWLARASPTAVVTSTIHFNE